MSNPEMCLPLWGKWIEISTRQRETAELTGVFPCGGSGLKFCDNRFSTAKMPVSSPVGEVD